jgi:WD40 repeat protein
MNEKGIISLSFNQDHNFFACCTETGVRIYNVEPLSLRERFDLGGISKCEMLNSSNFIAIVSGGKYPKYCQNTVLIYDAMLEKFVMEVVCDSNVKSVLLRRDKLVIVTVDKISVFTFPTAIKHIINLETRPNPMGLCEITPLETCTKQIIAYPGNKIGSVHIMDISNLEATSSSAPAILNAHQGEISCLAINRLGTLIASASSKGTLIRIWDTCHKIKVAELRRGSDTATLYCINFSPNSEFLCCSSDKGTVHIFAVIEPDLNRRSSLSPFSFFSSYCQSQWALATFTVPPEVGCICTFLTQDTVAAICLDGTYHMFAFSKDGTSRRKSFQIYLHNCEDDEF